MLVKLLQELIKTPVSKNVTRAFIDGSIFGGTRNKILRMVKNSAMQDIRKRIKDSGKK